MKKDKKDIWDSNGMNIGRFVIKRMNIWNSKLFLNSNGFFYFSCVLAVYGFQPSFWQGYFY